MVLHLRQPYKLKLPLMKSPQQLFSAFALTAIVFIGASCSSDNEVLSVEAGMTGKWEVASEQFLVDGKTAEELNIPRERTGVPPQGSILDFEPDKDLTVAIGETVVSNSTWRAGEDQNIFVALQSETVETEFAVRSLTGNSVTLYHVGEANLDEDEDLDKVEITIGLTRTR